MRRSLQRHYQRWIMRAVLLSIAVTNPAYGDETAPPRTRYNEGIEHLQTAMSGLALPPPPSETPSEEGAPPKPAPDPTQEALQKAELLLVQARDLAGNDADLRYRASFNLGLLHVSASQRHQTLLAALPQDAPDTDRAAHTRRAAEALRLAAQSFRDAVRARPEDPEARQNLELVLRTLQAMTASTNKAQLEARLDALIQQQRGVRDAIRAVMVRVLMANAVNDPVRFLDDFRTTTAQLRGVIDPTTALSRDIGDELDHLRRKTDEERTQEDHVRTFQLEQVTTHLERARRLQADARHSLRKLDANEAHLRADTALRALKRAREQFIDPVTLLQTVLRDQGLLFQSTAGLSQSAESVAPGAMPSVPPWLTPDALVDEQEDARDRTQELTLRFQGLAAALTQPQAPDQPPMSTDQRRILEGARDALPFVQAAVQAQANARDALKTLDLPRAQDHQLEALRQLSFALERFGDVRTLIDRALAEQQEIRDAIGGLADPAQTPQHPTLTQTRDQGFAHNNDRLTRLQQLFADEQANLQQKLAALPPEAQPAPGTTPSDPQAMALLQEQALYTEAERLRALAAAELKRLESLHQLPPELKPPAITLLDQSDATRHHLEQLQRLFFNLLEHLKDTARLQSEARDQVSSAQTLTDPTAQRDALWPINASQHDLSRRADALTDALTEEAKRAASQPPQPPQPGQPPPIPPQNFEQAAAEVRSSASAMRNALAQLSADTPDLNITTSEQSKSLEHLEKAIALLTPPPPPQKNQQNPQDQQNQDQQNQDQNQQKDQQDQQQDQPQDQQQEQAQNEDAERKLQSIRDREAERKRDQAERDQKRRALGREPVDKDW